MSVPSPFRMNEELPDSSAVPVADRYAPEK